MSKQQRLLLAVVLILMPLLAWNLMRWGQKISEKKILQRHRAEKKEMQQQLMALRRHRWGIEPGKRLSYPWSFDVIQPAPPGDVALLWVAPWDPDCYQDMRGWKKMLDRCPGLSLTALFGPATAEALKHVKGVPMGKMAATRYGLLMECGLDNGTFVVLDSDGIVLHVGQLEDACHPSPEDIRQVAEVVKARREKP